MSQDQPAAKPETDRHKRMPTVELYDPFNRMFRSRRQTDHFGAMFEEKIVNDDF